MNLYKEMSNMCRKDGISIFKSEYKEMVASGKLKKVPFTSPKYGFSEDGDALDNFINEYIKKLSDDERICIIDIYGVSNAIELLCLFHRNCLESTDYEIDEYFRESTTKYIETEAITLILHDAVGAYIDWKYL